MPVQTPPTAGFIRKFQTLKSVTEFPKGGYDVSHITQKMIQHAKNLMNMYYYNLN